MIQTLFYSIVLGLISGALWAFVLGNLIKHGLIYGAIAGLIVGLLLNLVQKMATSPGNIQKKEGSFVTGSVMGLIFMASTVIGIVIGLIRWIFF